VTKAKLLSIILIVLTILPLLIFATDFTSRAPLRTARAAAGRRAGLTQESQQVRFERRREERAKRRPTFGGAVIGLVVSLFWIGAVGIVGRRVFNLRL
jgi:hypothetical protein